jgi:hypothetical protein
MIAELLSSQRPSRAHLEVDGVQLHPHVVDQGSQIGGGTAGVAQPLGAPVVYCTFSSEMHWQDM